jgi:hypothetical protein
MNDNRPFHSLPSDQERRQISAIEGLNIGANGRWFVLALIAISLHVDRPRFAFMLALILGFSVILEQIPGRARLYAAIAVYILTGIVALALAAVAL